MDIEKLSYTAGFLDGEGCIYIAYHEKWAKTKNVYTLSVSINNTDKDIIYWLKNTFGGNVCEKKAKAYENKKRLWCWNKSAQQAEDFLRLVLPYLKVKHKHATVALKFRDTYHKGEWRPSEETRKERGICLQKMRKIMKKGNPLLVI